MNRFTGVLKYIRKFLYSKYKNNKLEKKTKAADNYGGFVILYCYIHSGDWRQQVALVYMLGNL